MNRRFPLFAVTLVFTAQSICAQLKTDSSAAYKMLPGFVVTGQYSPRKVEDAVQRIRVIDAKKISAMGAQNLRDVLLNEMSVSVAQDNVLGSSVQIQGISGQNVKILIDGIPVIGRQSGNIDIAQLNVYNVERIELVEGPMSVTYGTDALAGTINIITKSTVKSKLDAGVNTYTESVGRYNANANVGVHTGAHTFIVSGSRNFFSGWNPGAAGRWFNFADRPADRSRALLWDTKEEYNGNAQYSFRKNGMTFRAKSDYFYDIITNRGLPADYKETKAFDDYYYTTRFNNALFANGKIGSVWYVNFLASYSFYDRKKNTKVINLQNLTDKAGDDNDQDTSQYGLFNTRGTISRSALGERLSFEAGYDINEDYGSGKRILNGKQRMGDYAAYGSAEYKLLDSLSVRAGLRYTYNTAFQAQPVPSVNAKYNPVKGLTLRGAYARGFRSPSVKELFFEFKDSNHDIVGNDKLTPEKSNNCNVSASYSRKEGRFGFTFEGAAFYNSIKDMITLAQVDNTTLYTYVNVERFITKGVQVNVGGTFSNVSVNIGASYIGRFNQLSQHDARVTDVFSWSPEARFNAAWELPKYSLAISFFGKYTGAMPGYGLDKNGVPVITRLHGYTIGDASLSKKFLAGKLNLTGGVKNVFNTVNVNMSGGQATAGVHAGGSGTVSISTGRSVFFGVGYLFAQNR